MADPDSFALITNLRLVLLGCDEFFDGNAQVKRIEQFTLSALLLLELLDTGLCIEVCIMLCCGPTTKNLIDLLAAGGGLHEPAFYVFGEEELVEEEARQRDKRGYNCDGKEPLVQCQGRARVIEVKTD